MARGGLDNMLQQAEGHSLGISWPRSGSETPGGVCRRGRQSPLVKESLRALVGLPFQQYCEQVLRAFVGGGPFKVRLIIKNQHQEDSKRPPKPY